MFPANRLIEKKILTSINRLVHLLIELSYMDESKKDPYLQEAVNLIREIRPYMLNLIDGKEALLESLLRQLISQKLPHASMFSSFGHLQKDLSRIIAVALQNSDIDEDNEQPADITEQTEDISENPQEEPLPQKPGIEEKYPSSVPVETENDNLPDATAEEQYKTGPTAEAANSSEEPVLDTEIPVPTNSLENIITSFYSNEEIIKDYVYRSLLIDYYLPARKTAILTGAVNRRKIRMYEHLFKKDGIKVFEIPPGEEDNNYLLSRKLPHF